MSAHIHTYTYIHTRIQNVHMNARKARLKQRRGSDCVAAQLDTKKLRPSPCPHHDSAPSRPHPLICTGAEPIYPVHCRRQLPAWPCRPMAPVCMCVCVWTQVARQSPSYTTISNGTNLKWRHPPIMNACILGHVAIDALPHGVCGGLTPTRKR